MHANLESTRPAARKSAHARLYARILDADPADDGGLFFGVLTTGIYCLPSCRARKPKAENVVFFESCAAAREAGLRACLKCHPDDFELGADPVLEIIGQVVAELREDPGRFSDVAALVRRTGYGATRAGELFRRHFHATPQELVARARVAALQRILHEKPGKPAPLGDSIDRAGYASLSVAHARFRAELGISPAVWREMANPALRRFTIALPRNYPLALLLREIGRDPGSASERLDGNTFFFATRLTGIPVRLRLDFSESAVVVEISCESTVSHALAPAAHRAAVRMLGPGRATDGFVRAASGLGFPELVAGREGWSGSCFPDLWDTLALAIIGQQINLPFAFRLRRALTVLAGDPAGDGLLAPPSAAAVAALDPAALHALSFSGTKARTLVDTAKLVAGGELDLDALASGSATRAARRLLEIRGLGPWTVNYWMMRGAGFADCVPYGDTGVTSGLRALMKLDVRPDVAATRRLMEPFAPWRSLATFHLWQFLRNSNTKPK